MEKHVSDHPYHLLKNFSVPLKRSGKNKFFPEKDSKREEKEEEETDSDSEDITTDQKCMCRNMHACDICVGCLFCWDCCQCPNFRENLGSVI